VAFWSSLSLGKALLGIYRSSSVLFFHTIFSPPSSFFGMVVVICVFPPMPPRYPPPNPLIDFPYDVPPADLVQLFFFLRCSGPSPSPCRPDGSLGPHFLRGSSGRLFEFDLLTTPLVFSRHDALSAPNPTHLFPPRPPPLGWGWFVVFPWS